jgi:hypothetical protein
VKTKTCKAELLQFAAPAVPIVINKVPMLDN